MRTPVLAVGTVLAAAAATLFATTASAATPVSCGARITSSVVLKTDLTCSSGTALVLGGGAVLDLGGHTLRGSGDAGAQDNAGILFDADARATVKNGKITGFFQAIGSHGTGSGTLTASSVQLTGNQVGLSLDGISNSAGPKVTLTKSMVTKNDRGAGIYSGAAMAVSGSTFSANQLGIDTFAGSVALSAATFSSNDYGMTCEESACRVSRSRFTGSTFIGLQTKTTSAVVDTTQFDRNGVGWQVFQTYRDQGTNNLFLSNKTGLQGILVGMDLRQNAFVGNTTGLDLSGFDGIGRPTRIQQNLFTGNTDGVRITDPETAITLAGNIAVANKRIGINAPYAIDGGGNIASGNGSRPQCVGVRC